MTGTIGPGALPFDPAPLAREEPDQAEIKRFYDHYRPILERYARRSGSADPAGIADLAFFDGLRAASTLRHPTEASFRAYLFRAVRSRLASEARRKRFELVPLDTDDQALAVDLDIGGSVVDTILVADLLDSLTADQRQVLRHRFYGGHTATETAALLDKSPGAVRKLQHDAIARLRRIVAATGVAVLVLVAILAMGVVGGRRGGQRVVVEPASEPAPPARTDGSPPSTGTTPVPRSEVDGGRGPTDAVTDPDGDADGTGPSDGPTSAPTTGRAVVGPATSDDPVPGATTSVTGRPSTTPTTTSATSTTTTSTTPPAVGPTAVPDTASTDEDPITVDVLANDRPGDGELVPATLRIVTGPGRARSVTITDAHRIRYSPREWNGVDRLTYEICDANGLCDQASLTIDVDGD